MNTTTFRNTIGRRVRRNYRKDGSVEKITHELVCM